MELGVLPRSLNREMFESHLYHIDTTTYYIPIAASFATKLSALMLGYDYVIVLIMTLSLTHQTVKT